MYLSNKSNTVSEMCKKNTAFMIYILIATIYLGSQMFQGFSFLDIGIYMSGYQHFNNEPFSTYYLGQWLLTYHFSAFLCKIMSVSSFMGLRIIHLVFTLLSQTIIYLYLKKYIRTGHIIAGLTLATLAHFGSYTEINYNDYSVGLLTLSIISAHHGITRNKIVAIITSGILAGIAIFFRMVNITFLTIPFMIWFISLRWYLSVNTGKMFLTFFTGTALGIASILLILHAGSMTDILTLTIHDLISIGGDPHDSHSLKTIILCAYTLYKGEIQGFSVIFLITVLISLNNIKFRGLKKHTIRCILSLLIILNIYLWEAPSNITVGICFAALPTVYLSPYLPTTTATLYVMSLFIPLVFPIGSNAGPEFYGKDICYLSLPLAISIIANGKILIKERYRESVIKAVTLSYVFICAAMVYTNIKRPMMEEGNRLQCKYSIDSRLTKGILTTKENAELCNYLIHTLKPILPSNSYMICNFSIPMISLLECKPYAVFSTIFTTEKMNGRYIDTAYKHTGKLPYLLTDKSNISYKDKQVEVYLNNIHPYTTVWEDNRYTLKAPNHHQTKQ